MPPAPSTPTPGKYVGPYRLLTTETYSNSTGMLDPVIKKPAPYTCTYNLAIDGTVTITTAGSGSSFTADVNDSFTETQLSTTCQGPRVNGSTISGGAVDYRGSSDTIHILTSSTQSGTSRSHDFTGFLNGNTITGKVTKTFSSTSTPPSGSGAPPGTTITGNYGPSSATVILQKK